MPEKYGFSKSAINLIQVLKLWMPSMSSCSTAGYNEIQQ